MEAIILVLIVLGCSLQSVCKKSYFKRAGGVFCFTGASSLFAMFVFIFTAQGELDFKPEIILYSIAFAVVYCTASIGGMMAIKTGSLSLTSLFTQYSLLIPTFFGILFYDEKTGPMFYIGLGLLSISLWIINYVKEEGRQFKFKWVVFIILAFVGNGFCSVVQQVQQKQFESLFKSEFMIVALAIVAVTNFTLAAFTEKREMLRNLSKGLGFYIICGMANGLVNYLVLLLYGMGFPASVSNPIISASGIVLTGIISVTVYKEKLTKNQIIGIIFGIMAIVVLNLH